MQAGRDRLDLLGLLERLVETPQTQHELTLEPGEEPVGGCLGKIGDEALPFAEPP